MDGEICLIDRDGHLVLETVFTDLICYHPETMVGMFAYPNPADPEEQKVFLPAAQSRNAVFHKQAVPAAAAVPGYPDRPRPRATPDQAVERIFQEVTSADNDGT